MTPLQKAFVQLHRDLYQVGLRWAVIGGLAVSIRGEPRTTRDLDVAVAVSNDLEAENAAGKVLGRGYRFEQPPLEQLDVGRLATVRLVTTKSDFRGIVVDLMFASSGIEDEVVEASEVLEVFPGFAAPLATTAHLLALKTLAGREKDVADFATLVRFADRSDLLAAREALELIARRGYDRGKNLQTEFVKLLERAPREI